MARASSLGQMARDMKVNFVTTSFKVKEYMIGLTEDDMKENGKVIKWMGEAYLHGLMEGDMKESILTIKSTVMVNLNGLMEENIKGFGSVESSTVKEFTLSAKIREEKVNGLKEGELSGTLDYTIEIISCFVYMCKLKQILSNYKYFFSF